MPTSSTYKLHKISSSTASVNKKRNLGIFSSSSNRLKKSTKSTASGNIFAANGEKYATRNILSEKKSSSLNTGEVFVAESLFADDTTDMSSNYSEESSVSQRNALRKRKRMNATPRYAKDNLENATPQQAPQRKKPRTTKTPRVDAEDLESIGSEYTMVSASLLRGSRRAKTPQHEPSLHYDRRRANAHQLVHEISPILPVRHHAAPKLVMGGSDIGDADEPPTMISSALFREAEQASKVKSASKKVLRITRDEEEYDSAPPSYRQPAPEESYVAPTLFSSSHKQSTTKYSASHQDHQTTPSTRVRNDIFKSPSTPAMRSRQRIQKQNDTDFVSPPRSSHRTPQQQHTPVFVSPSVCSPLLIGFGSPRRHGVGAIATPVRATATSALGIASSSKVMHHLNNSFSVHSIAANTDSDNPMFINMPYTPLITPHLEDLINWESPVKSVFAILCILVCWAFHSGILGVEYSFDRLLFHVVIVLVVVGFFQRLFSGSVDKSDIQKELEAEDYIIISMEVVEGLHMDILILFMVLYRYYLRLTAYSSYWEALKSFVCLLGFALYHYRFGTCQLLFLLMLWMFASTIQFSSDEEDDDQYYVNDDDE